MTKEEFEAQAHVVRLRAAKKRLLDEAEALAEKAYGFDIAIDALWFLDKDEPSPEARP